MGSGSWFPSGIDKLCSTVFPGHCLYQRWHWGLQLYFILLVFQPWLIRERRCACNSALFSPFRNFKCYLACFFKNNTSYLLSLGGGDVRMFQFLQIYLYNLLTVTIIPVCKAVGTSVFQLAKEYGMDFYETSACTNVNIKEVRTLHMELPGVWCFAASVSPLQSKWRYRTKESSWWKILGLTCSF